MNKPIDISQSTVQSSKLSGTIKRYSKLIIYNLLLIIISCTIITGCKVYSFSPAKVSSDLKTITIQNVVMGTAGGPANLTLTFTEKLKEYYQRNTSLKLKPNDADLLIESTIVGYELTPVSATSSDQAALNRLTIRVEVRFVNAKNEEENFEKEFSFYQDFAQEQTLAQVEGSLVPKIIDQLVLNIFTDTAAQW
ncbi:MAG: LptE family protein [Emticicia sp.]|uniref:LptE family protein n=1 Tax=Emticicia sp. TaxID=1930953 RepID=UPI003BA404FD